jgi:predicted aspartyl protease
MGMTYVDIEVASVSDPEITETIRFIVDSGATYSVVPAVILERLGIQPITEERFILTNGDTIARKKGVAIFKYKDRIGGSDFVFGDPGDENLLGALTLESLGFALDPLRRELRNLPLMLA